MGSSWAKTSCVCVCMCVFTHGTSWNRLERNHKLVIKFFMILWNTKQYEDFKTSKLTKQGEKQHSPQEGLHLKSQIKCGQRWQWKKKNPAQDTVKGFKIQWSGRTCWWENQGLVPAFVRLPSNISEWLTTLHAPSPFFSQIGVITAVILNLFLPCTWWRWGEEITGWLLFLDPATAETHVRQQQWQCCLTNISGYFSHLSTC